MIARIAAIEKMLGADEGERGMAALVVPGDLAKASETICKAALELSHRKEATHNKGVQQKQQRNRVLILSGFPCCVDQVPPTESDGPPGSFSLARTVVALGFVATIVTDECNRDVFEAALKSIGTTRLNEQDGSQIFVDTFPAECDIKDIDEMKMKTLLDDCALIIACERAGPAADGDCYTMRGINMSKRNLIAPLHRFVDMARHRNLVEGGEHIPFIAIGDGGNELGMGKVYQQILDNRIILNGKQIAAVTEADHLIAASISNWGAYGLSAATALMIHHHEQQLDDETSFLKTRSSTISDWLTACLPSEEDEIQLLRRCIEAGCRDGVTGRIELSVDGFPIQTSLERLRLIRHLAEG